MWWEYALVAAAVLAAAGFVGRTAYRSLRGRKSGCACPGGCKAAKLPPR